MTELDAYRARPFRAETRTAFVNMAFKAVSVPAEKICRLALFAIAAPALGQAGFGTYQFAATVTTLLMLCTEMGLGVWTTRAVARDRTSASAVVATALRIRMLALIPYSAAVFVACFVSGSGATRTCIGVLAVAAVANAFCDYTISIFRGFERIRDEAWLNGVRALVTTTAGLGALQLSRGVSSLSLGLLVGAAVSAGYALSILRRHYGLSGSTLEAGRDRSLAKAAVAQGIPLWLVTMVYVLYARGDVILLRCLAGAAELGAYSAADRLFESLTILSGVILAAGFPPLVRAQRDPGRRRSWEILLVGLLLGAGMAASITFWLFGGRIVLLVYGPEFARAGDSLRVLALAAPLGFLNLGLSHILIARNLERHALLFAIFALVANVTSNLLLIPRLGGPGAAWAAVLTELTMTISCLALLRRHACRESRASAELCATS